MEHMLGIDFGTTNSLVAIFENGRPITLHDNLGNKVIPSAVYIDEDGEVFIGKSAKNVSILHIDRTIMSVKRELGSDIRHNINGYDYSPEEIASFIFKALKKTAEDYVGQPVENAVVTVPAYYDDKKRQSTKLAANLAGLKVSRLVNEPTAASLSYGLDKKNPGLILVYDLGGGTFDVSLLQVSGGVFQVLATRGDTNLGGDDFDRKIKEIILSRFEEEYGIDLRDDKLAVQKVYEASEKAKITLSEKQITDIDIPFITANENGPLHLSTRLTRLEFEELIEGYIEKTIRYTKGVLNDAGLKPNNIDKLILVGGSTRIPYVRKAIKSLLNKNFEKGVQPDEVVALGAAVQSAVLSGKLSGTVLVDVTPLSLGVKTEGDIMVTMIHRNTVLPAHASAVFTTVKDFQHSVLIDVLQGERKRASKNIALGSFKLEGIKPAKRGKPGIRVSFEIDVEGIVHVSAEDIDTKSSNSISIKNINNLTTEEIEKIINEARASELDDLGIYQ